MALDQRFGLGLGARRLSPGIIATASPRAKLAPTRRMARAWQVDTVIQERGLSDAMAQAGTDFGWGRVVVGQDEDALGGRAPDPQRTGDAVVEDIGLFAVTGHSVLLHRINQVLDDLFPVPPLGLSPDFGVRPGSQRRWNGS